MDDHVELSVRQFAEAWRLMCTRVPGHTAAAVDGLEYIFSGRPIAFFNVAVLTGRGIDTDALKARAERACAWSSNKGVPWLFIVTREALDPATDPAVILDACGLAPIMTLTGMYAHRVAPVAHVPDGLQLTVPQSDSECSAVVDINAAAYGMDLEPGKDLIGKRSFWTDHFAVLGLTGGRPACCAAVLMVDGIRYVALVATDPAQQRRGYADAAMRRALELSAEVHGERPTVLHATDAGRPVYERMGYAPITTHTLFMETALLAGH